MTQSLATTHRRISNCLLSAPAAGKVSPEGWRLALYLIVRVPVASLMDSRAPKRV
jgi:hypothetical protein